MKFPWRYLLVIAAVTAGCLLLAACGGEEEEAVAPSTATPAAATEVATPEETPTEEAMEEEGEEEGIERLLDLGIIDLEDALLTADDVPDGLTPAALERYPQWDAEEQPVDACGTDMTFPDYSDRAVDNYDYEQDGNIFIVIHGIGLFDIEKGDAKKVVALLRELAERCDDATVSIDGEEYSVQTAPLPFPKLGDETFAVQTSVETEGFGMETVTVIMRRGNIINEVELLGEPGSVPAQLAETLARLADEKLKGLTES